MKKNISFILLTLAMLMVVPLSAFAIVAPHTAANGNQVGCSSCHNATVIAPTSVNNMCVNCHKPGANVKVTSYFYQTDPANPYNRFVGYSNGIVPSKMKSTSHNWTGTEEVPQAGATRPVDGGMSPATLGTNISCARCHNIHGPRSTATVTAPFLRAPNGNDEMCRDCHRVRDVSNHTLGSHPINFRYTSATSKVRTNPTEYYSTPRNANPANPTSAMLLVNGKVQCSTCHSTHYADSNSGTVDSRATWANLSASRGMLLRTDTFGKTTASTSVNICTNCHNKPNHMVYTGSSTVTTPIQCVDCHSGHVEYISDADKALGGDDAKPNVYMLRRYMNYSSGVKLSTYRKKAFLTTTSSSAVYRNASNTTICQACHKLPANVTAHSTATTAADCTPCHGASASHTTTPPVGCTGCHGSPPEHTAAGTIKYTGVDSSGYAVYSSVNNPALITKSYNLSTPKVYKNESTAGHPTHSAGKPYRFTCAECHNGNSHATQTYQDVFLSPGSMSPAGTFLKPTNTRSTCNNMYCHSYGTAALTKPKLVPWSSGVRGTFMTKTATTRCVLCHNGVVSTYNNLSTASHFRHVSNNVSTGKVYTCNVCHSATVSNNTNITSYTNHVNNARELSVDAAVIAGKLVGSTLSGTTCATYCHTDGAGNAPVTALDWTSRASGKCDSCHKTATNTFAAGIISSNAHFAHISSSYGPKRNTNALCNNCHVYTGELAGTHVDGTISKNSGATLCLNCHSQTTPTWTYTSARLSCESCHSGRGTTGTTNVTGSVDIPGNAAWATYDASGVIRAPFKAFSTFTNRGHGQYAGVYCTDCHNQNSKHLNGAVSAAGTYKGARIFANFSGMNTTWKADNLCVECHNDGAHGGNTVIANVKRINLKSHVTDRSTTFSYCISCHDNHGSSNEMGIKKIFNVYTGNGRGAAVKTVIFTNYTSGFVNASRTGICQVCHTNTKAYRNYTSRITRLYTGTVVYEGSWGHQGGNKKCLTCHDHASSTYAFYPAGGVCNSCHGYPPMTGDGKTNPVATSTVHGSHNMSAKQISDGMSGTTYGMACTVCHITSSHMSVGAANVGTTIAPAANKFNSSLSQTYTAYSCSNVSCHFKASPAWR